MEYNGIVEHYEKCYEKYGDTSKGVDWPTKERADRSYVIMLDIVKYYKTIIGGREENFKLLDFGCGLSHLYGFIANNIENYSNLSYVGLDISKNFVNASKLKYPNNSYLNIDILKDSKSLGIYDFIIMNGVFTEKLEMSHEDMMNYFQKMIHAIIPHCKYGLAFNLISKQVDWERKDLFHVPMDELANFLCKEITRDFIIRNDTSEYVYTVYVFPKSAKASK